MRKYILLLIAATAMAGCGVLAQNDRIASNYSSSSQLDLCFNVHGLDPDGFTDCVRNSNSVTPGVACTTPAARPMAMRCIAEENERRQGLQTASCQELFGASCGKLASASTGS
jgi:hypothetical protein